jgi:hypothetical protein
MIQIAAILQKTNRNSGWDVMSGWSPTSEVESHSRRVHSTPMNGHRQTGPTGPFRASLRHAVWLV